jgi:hypothetical protein
MLSMFRTRTHPFVRASTHAIALLIVLLAWNSPQAQDEHSQLDDVSADVAQAIIKNSRGAPLPVEVFVGDFQERNGDVNLLGVSLANEFASTLTKYAGKGRQVIDRAQLTGISWSDLTDPNTWRCYGKRQGTPVVLEGTLEVQGDALTLSIRAQEFHAPSFNRQGQVLLTPKLKELASTNLPIPSQPTWVSRDHPADQGVEPRKPGANGVSYPACIYCPGAQYSPAGTIAKIEGTVLLDVIITADGFPGKITVVRGLACGTKCNGTKEPALLWNQLVANDRIRVADLSAQEEVK